MNILCTANEPLIVSYLRLCSKPLTWLLLRLDVRPNEITLIGILGSVVSASLYVFGLWYLGLAAMFLVVLLDYSDGAVSRIRKLQSKEGSYLDKVYIFSVHPILFAGLSIGLYEIFQDKFILVAGFIDAISVTLLCVAIEYAIQIVVWIHIQRLLDRLSKNNLNEFDLNAITLMQSSDRGVDNMALESFSHITKGQVSFRKLLQTLMTFWDFPWIFCIMGGVILIQTISQHFSIELPFNFMVAFLYFYAITYPVLILIFILKNVYKQEVEARYKKNEAVIFDLLVRRLK